MSDERKRFIDRIQLTTGYTIEKITQLVVLSNLEKHSEVRSLLIEELKLTYGDANTLTHYIMKTDGQSLSEGKDLKQVIDEIYSDKKIGLRPIHDLLMNQIILFGPFEIIPKKGYISLKRKRQFAMIGPKSSSRIEIGINLKSDLDNSRFIAQPKGSMCQYIVNVTSIEDVDDKLISTIKQAYEQSE